MSDAAMEDWISRAREANPLEVAQSLGAKLRRQGVEWVGPCPVGCCSTDGFAINVKDKVFICRKGGAKGDVINMTAHLLGLDAKKDFVRVCETILQEPPPRGESRAAEPDPAIQKERREERVDDGILKKREEDERLARRIAYFTRVFGEAEPIHGWMPIDYLEMRGIDADILDSADLRFIRSLEYRGFEDSGAEEEILLGEFPCMIAAARNARGEIQALHRTYLDLRQPKKLRPPGDPKRNSAKKAWGDIGGTLIMLKRPQYDRFAAGEGIESSASWFALAREGWFGDEWACAGVGAAYSLHNLCGSSLDRAPHPRKPKATIHAGEPDMASTAMWVPEGIQALALLGDGDSDPVATRAHMVIGAKRYKRLGIDAYVCMAPTHPTHWKTRGEDFNDLHRRLQAKVSEAA